MKFTPMTDNERRIHTPLRKASRYPPVMQEFIKCWIAANNALAEASEPPITLSGGYGAERLASDRDEILEWIRTQSALDRAFIIAVAVRDQAKSELMRRHVQIRDA